MAISFAEAGASTIVVAARGDLSKTVELVHAVTATRARPRVLPIKVDIADNASVDAAAKLCYNELDGKLDILINNAGIFDGTGPLAETDPETWWNCMTINVKGPYLMIRAFLPLLLASELKTLINVASVGAHLVTRGNSSYQTSKLAVMRLTEFVAEEYGKEGIIAISVHPGNVLTEIVGMGESFSEELKAVFTETPRLSADSLVFLCGERREWLGGRYVNLTWDMEEFTGEEKKREIVEGDKLKVRMVV